jgi:hypothetical protein
MFLLVVQCMDPRLRSDIRRVQHSQFIFKIGVVNPILKIGTLTTLHVFMDPDFNFLLGSDLILGRFLGARSRIDALLKVRLDPFGDLISTRVEF